MDENQLKAVLTKYFGEKTGNVTRETSKDELKCIYDERSGTYDQVHNRIKKKWPSALQELLARFMKGPVFFSGPLQYSFNHFAVARFFQSHLWLQIELDSTRSYYH